MRGETSKTVTFTSTSDDVDESNETVTLAFGTLPARVTVGTTASTTVTITDNDTRGITVSPASLTVTEGTTGTYTVVLNSEPTGDVTVTVGGASGDVSVDTDTDTTDDQDTLTFTTSNWSTAQMVTVAAAEDEDGVGDMPVTLTNTASGGDYGSESASVSVTITEDDTAMFSVIGPMSVGEDAGTATYTVTLSAQPAQNVMVDYATADGTATAGSDYTMASGTLTFTTTNWSIAQTVDVTITNDSVDEDNETITFTLSSPTDGASLSMTPSRTTTITDNDTRGLTLSTTSLTVGENANGTYTVKLDSQPTMGSVTVTVGGATGDVSVDTDSIMMGDQNTLVFTTTNWDTAQTVIVAAADDNDAVPDTAVVLTHTASGADYASVTGESVTVTITENDMRGVTVDTDTSMMGVQTSLTVDENMTGNYTVVLDSEPTGDVTVMVNGASGDVSVSPSSLTFTTMNWSTAQTVTVTAADDDDAVPDADVTLTHSVSGADYSMPTTTGSVTVTITENDMRGVTVTPTALSVTEGSTGNYMVKLNSQPMGNVTVTVTGAMGDVSVDTSTAAGDQNTLTFAPSTWNTAQTVEVRAAEDMDAVADAAVTLTNTASGGDYVSSESASVEVTIVEDDTATFSVTGPARVGEGDGTATYTVSLSAQPGSNVTVAYATANGTAMAVTDYTAASGTLTFTPTNWNTPQTVDVTIMYDAEDMASESDETFTFTLSDPTGGAALSASPSVTTTITVWPNVQVSFAATTPYNVVEGDMVGVVVNLDMNPRRTVTIPLTAASLFAVRDTEYTFPTSVTFMSGETSKTLTFTAIRDGMNEGSIERVVLGFGTLPSGVTVGSTSSAAVRIPANGT